MKIHIIGQSGSGKTYFSKRIAEQTNIEYVEMDQINKDVKYNLTKFYENSEWIIDGKYKKVRKRLKKRGRYNSIS